MVNYDGSIRINTKVDDAGAIKSIDKISSSVKKLGKTLFAAFSVKAFAKIGKTAISLASDLSEVQNVVDTVFGSMSGSVDEFAKNAIMQFGLSELSAKKYASTFGAMVKSMGIDTQNALKMSTRIAGLAGDIASFYNVSTEEAFTALSGIATGSTETLKRFGIAMTVANLESFALSEGITKSYESMTQAEKVALRYKYVLNATSQAQGDFAKTSDSWANQTRILKEQFNTLLGTLGAGLINVLNPLLQTLTGIVTQFNALIAGSKSSGNTMTDAAKNAADAQKELAKSIEGTDDALSGALAGFDKLNVLSEKEASEEVVGSNIYIEDSLGNMEVGKGIKISKDLEVLVERIKEIGENIGKIFTSVKDVIKKMNEEVSPILKNMAFGVLVVIRDLLGFIAENMDILLPMILGAVAAWSAYKIVMLAVNAVMNVNPINLIITAIGALVLGIALLIKNWDDVKEKSTDVWNKIVEIWGKVADWFNEKVIEPIKEAFNTAMDWLKTNILPVFEKIFGHIKDYFVGIWDSIKRVFQGFLDFFAGVFTGDWQRALDGIKNIFGGIWDAIKNKFETTVKIFFSVFEKIFPDFETKFKATWERVRDIFSNVWDGIRNIFKGAINGILGFAETFVNGFIKTINGIINALNKISVNIPDWVPIYGGQKFGINISTIKEISIPRLAQGAVIPPNQQFLAVLGDQTSGTNIETPLDTMIQAFRTALRDMGHLGNSDGRPIEVTLNLDGTRLAKVLLPRMNTAERQRGYNLVIGEVR